MTSSENICAVTFLLAFITCRAKFLFQSLWKPDTVWQLLGLHRYITMRWWEMAFDVKMMIIRMMILVFKQHRTCFKFTIFACLCYCQYINRWKLTYKSQLYFSSASWYVTLKRVNSNHSLFNWPFNVCVVLQTEQSCVWLCFQVTEHMQRSLHTHAFSLTHIINAWNLLHCYLQMLEFGCETKESEFLPHAHLRHLFYFIQSLLVVLISCLSGLLSCIYVF